MTALLIYPTHANIREELESYADMGIDAAVYPPRTIVDTEHMLQNCWNEQADQAQQIGLPAGKAICLSCKYREMCLAGGYLAQMIKAKNADVALATHQRVAHTGFGDLTKDRQYISLNEAPIDVLRPKVALKPGDLKAAGEVLNRLLSDPDQFDWFADDCRTNDEGEWIHFPKQQLGRERLYDGCLILADMIDDLIKRVESATQSQPWKPAVTMKLPSGLERLLFKVSAQMQQRYNGAPWRLLLKALGGELESITIMVSEHHVMGQGQGATTTVKWVVGVRCNSPPTGKIFWVSDATLDADRLQSLLDVPVQDATPDGQIPLQKKAVQFVRDVTRQTLPMVVAALLRALLVARPDVTRLGLITHRPMLAALALLEPEYRERIALSSYFGSGDERSSNAWHQECDLIVVAGTPRIPPDGISEYLVEVREIEAACRVPPWDTVIWHGTTESGADIEVQARGYHDAVWRAAQRELVRATLVQAVGRGRGILESGCDVIVLSNEECGLAVADAKLEPMGHSEQRVLEQMRGPLTITFSIKELIGKMSVSSSEVAEQIDKSEPQVRRLLVSLEHRGLVHRLGPRSGWSLGPRPMADEVLVDAVEEGAPCPLNH